MSWTVYAGNDLIYNHLVPGYDNLIEPSLNCTTEEFCSLSFGLPVENKGYAHVQHLRPYIRVFDGARLYWTGRVLTDEPDIYGTKNIYVEDRLGVLCDSIIRPFEFSGTVTEFLTKIIDEHNEQVEDHQKIAGIICSDETSINRASEGYNTAWSILKSRILDMVGGYMWLSYDSEEKPYLNYSTTGRDTSTQEIVLGENLAELAIKNASDTLYTACIPLGKKDDETKEYVTIASVNDGKDYLIDTGNAAVYGIIYAPPSETTWEDVTEPANLLKRGQDWIQNQASRFTQEIDLSAVDLHFVNANVESFRWLDQVVTRVPSRGLNASFLIKSITIRLDMPTSPEIRMGYEGKPLTASTIDDQKDVDKKILDISSGYVTRGEAETIANEQINQSTYITTTVNSIIAGALEEYVRTGDFETFKRSMETQFSVLNGQIEARFTATEDSITTLDGETTRQFSEIHSFIRLMAQTSTVNGGIVIGESTSQIKLKLENDILYFFTGDEKTVSVNNAIAYFSAGKLYVVQSQIQQLTIGTTGRLMDFYILGSGENTAVGMIGRLS